MRSGWSSTRSTSSSSSPSSASPVSFVLVFGSDCMTDWMSASRLFKAVMPWPDMCNCFCCCCCGGVEFFACEGDDDVVDDVEAGGARGLAGPRIGIVRVDPIVIPDLMFPCCCCCCCCGCCCRDASNNPLNPSTNLSLSPSTNRCKSRPCSK